MTTTNVEPETGIEGTQGVENIASGELGPWRAWASATGPADRAAAENGVRRAYRLAGLAEPERVVWVGSPRAAITLIRDDLSDRGPSVRDAVRCAPEHCKDAPCSSSWVPGAGPLEH
jgi:hypothetical protein